MNNIDTIIKKLSLISTPNISDAMGKGLSRPLKHQTMDSAIKPLSATFRLFGPAYTVRCYPGATYAMEKAINLAPAGSVIVCDGQGSDAGVMMGELMSTVAQYRGVVGAVIDGAVRDIDAVIEMEFPVFTRHVTACSGTFDTLGDLEEIISCGSVVVRPGDIIGGDVNGVVVVPCEIAGPVVRSAQAIQDREKQIKKLLLQGCSLEDAAGQLPKFDVQQI